MALKLKNPSPRNKRGGPESYQPLLKSAAFTCQINGKMCMAWISHWPYRGFRHAALDPLVAAVSAIEGDAQYSVPKATILRELRREFVSELFRILGPEHHNKEVGRIIRTSHSSRKDDLTVGGLLQGESIPPGATAVLQKVISRIEGRSSGPKIDPNQNDR